MPYPRRLLWDILPRNTPNSQNLLLRCPPTDFTDLHRYLGCTVLPQNSQNTQNLAAWVWQGCHTLLHLCASVSSVGGSSQPEVSVRSVRSVGISFLPRISQIYTDTYGALFSHRIHRIHRIGQRGYGRDAIPSYICAHPCHLWEALLSQKFLCVPCVLWEYLFSHGFHRFTQMLRVRFVPTEFTESIEFVSVGMAGMPYPPTSVNIRAVCGRLFSARGSVSSVLICGRLFSARSFCAFRAFCGNIFSPTEFTESTEFVSVGIAGMPYPPNLCASVPSVGVLSLQEVLCIRCIPWELLHRLFGWCSRDCCTPWRNPRK